MLTPSFPSITLLFLAYCLSTPTFAKDDASLHQVFLAAEAGNFKEAQSMMDNVLKNHPNSAKAHFVEAELLAKQGLNSNASAELNKAEQLEPALTFAKPEALQSLKNRIGGTATSAIKTSIVHESAPTMAMPNNWLMPVLLFIGLGVLILFIMALFRRNTQSLPTNSHPAYAPNSNNGAFGNPGMGSPSMGQPAAGGMGSGLMGNLATGAALGAGVVAGEALMHHFIDGDHNNSSNQNQQPDNSPWGSSANSANNDSSSSNYDMGGNDFGVQDSSSWDDDSSGGGDDDNW